MTEQKELPCPSCKQLPETMTQGIYTGLVCRVENRCPRPLALWRLCVGDAREGWNELVRHAQPAEDERVKEIRRRWAGLPLETIKNDMNYLLSLLPVQPAQPDPCAIAGRHVCGPLDQPATSTPTENEIDEVQHRADEVVNTAIQWHQSGREGDGTWFDKAEALGAAIDRLLELRQSPTTAAKPPMDDSDDHGLQCSRWIQYDHNHRQYDPTRDCSCRPAAASTEAQNEKET